MSNPMVAHGNKSERALLAGITEQVQSALDTLFLGKEDGHVRIKSRLDEWYDLVRTTHICAQQQVMATAARQTMLNKVRGLRLHDAKPYKVQEGLSWKLKAEEKTDTVTVKPAALLDKYTLTRDDLGTQVFWFIREKSPYRKWEDVEASLNYFADLLSSHEDPALDTLLKCKTFMVGYEKGLNGFKAIQKEVKKEVSAKEKAFAKKIQEKYGVAELERRIANRIPDPVLSESDFTE